MNYFVDNIENVVLYFCIPILIGIFTFATPLILQTVSRVDDKYDSTLLAKLFLKDRICKCFIITLGISFVAIIIWILQIPRIIDLGFGIFNELLDNSASLILILSTILLIVTTCFILYLTYIFYIPKELTKRLKKQYKLLQNKNKIKDALIYFEGISKIFNYSTTKADEDLARQTYSIFKEVISDLIKIKSSNENVSIEEVCANIFEANEKLLKRERTTLSYLHDSSILGIFITDYNIKLSREMYMCLWICLRQAVFYNNTEAIKGYWEVAHQYALNKQYDSQLNITNQKEIVDKFKEFHYALGGLLLYHKMYNVLKYIMSWTNTNPPTYTLVPSAMHEVIKMYMLISSDDNDRNFLYYEEHYPFIGIRGVKANDTICFWIKKYLAVLFLRQYTLTPYYVFDNKLQMPQPPNTISEKRTWSNRLDDFKKIVESIKNDSELLEGLGFDYMKNDEWFKEQNKETPLGLIESFKAKIKSELILARKNQSISESKLNEFKKSTKNILCPMFKQYQDFFNNKEITKDYNNFYLRGEYQVLDKQAYADDQEISYVDYDSFVANYVSLKFHQIAPTIFLCMQYEKYLLKEQDVWEVITKFSSSSMKDKLVIFSIGNNLSYFASFNNSIQNKDGEWSFKDIPIIDMQNRMNYLITNSFYILRKSDIPLLVFNTISEEVKNKYQLEEIDKNYHLFVSILDVNQNQNIKDELMTEKNENVDTKAVVCVDFNAEIRCNKTAKVIQIQMYSQFKNKEQANSVDDVDYKWLN